jgi:hypothetical protein
MTVDIEKRVGQYVKLRDRIKELEEQHEKELAPYKSALETLNEVLLQHLNSVNAESARTANGTVTRCQKKSCTIADKSAFWTFVVTQGKFDMIEYKANVKAVEDYIKSQAAEAQLNPGKGIEVGPPPGVNYSTRFVVGVRRA